MIVIKLLTEELDNDNVTTAYNKANKYRFNESYHLRGDDVICKGSISSDYDLSNISLTLNLYDDLKTLLLTTFNNSDFTFKTVTSTYVEFQLVINSITDVLDTYLNNTSYFGDNIVKVPYIIVDYNSL